MEKKPEAEQKKKYFELVEKNIADNGYHVTNVLEEIGFTPFGYSTGISKNFKIPELYISGLPPRLTQTLIDEYCKRYRSSEIPLGQLIEDLSDRFSVYLIKVENEKLEDQVLSTIKYYEIWQEEYTYLQLVFPDLEGNFPGQENYDYDQKIFGEMH